RPPTKRHYYFAVLLVLVDVCRAAVHRLAEIAGSRLLPFLPLFVPAAIPVLLALTAHMLVAVIRHLNLVHSNPLVVLPCSVHWLVVIVVVYWYVPYEFPP